MNSNNNNNNSNITDEQINGALSEFQNTVSNAPILKGTIEYNDFNVPQFNPYAPIESEPSLGVVDTTGGNVPTSKENVDYGYTPLQVQQNNTNQQVNVSDIPNMQLQGLPQSSSLSKYNYGSGDTPLQVAQKIGSNLALPLRPYESIQTGNYATDILSNLPLSIASATGKGAAQLATGAISAIPQGIDVLDGMAYAPLFENPITQNLKYVPTEKELQENPSLAREWNSYQQWRSAREALASPIIEGYYSKGNALNKIGTGLKSAANLLWNKDSNLNLDNLKNYWSSVVSGDDKEFIKQQSEAVNRFGDTGLFDALDVISLGQAGKIRILKIADSINKVKKTKTLAQSVTEAINKGDFNKAADYVQYISKALASQKFDGVYNKLSSFNKEFANIDLAKVIKSTEEGNTVKLTSKELKAKQKLRSMMDEYHNILDEMGLAVDRRVQSIAQNLCRKFNIEYHEAMKILTPIIENQELYQNSVVRKFNNMAQYYVDTLSDILGVSKSEIQKSLSKSIRKDKDGELTGKQVGKFVFDTGDIILKDLKSIDTLSHEIAHKFMDETIKAVKSGNAKATKWINEVNEQIFDKAGIPIKDTISSGVHEIMAYSLEKFLNPNFKLPKDLKGLSSGVNINESSQMFKDAVKFWENKFTAKDMNNMNFTDEALDMLRNSSDEKMRAIAEANYLYTNGDIFPVPHVDAGNYAGMTKDVARRYASVKGGIERVYGLQKYEEIADVMRNTDYLSDNLSRTIGDKIAVNELKQAGYQLNKKALKADDIAYVSADDFNNAKSVQNLEEKANLVKANPDDVPVSRKVLRQIVKNEEFSRNAGNPYVAGNPMNTFYKFERSIMLASGKYLVGNITSTGFNTLINSNIRLADDLASSARTGGKLSRLLGVKRPMKATEIPFENKVLATADKYTNKPIRDAFNAVDITQQNFAAETSINNYLAKKGIPVSQRAEYIKNASAPELYEMISTAQDTAALNTRFSLIPESLRPIVATVFPFYRWGDTAVRSTINTWKRNPLMSDLAVNHFLGQFSFDQEMQNRMRIQADMDKPYVHIHYNPATGKYRDESAELSPQVTALKMGSTIVNSLYTGKYQDIVKSPFETNASLTPVGYGFVNSFFGNDEYGNPLFRTQDADGNPILVDRDAKVRYRLNPDGSTTPIGMLPDEIIPNVAKQTLAPVKFYNKTVMPAEQLVLDALGQPRFMFNPNATGITPSFDPNNPNVNPNRLITQDESLRSLLGVYTTPEYNYPSNYGNGNLTPRQLQQLMRQRGRQMNRADFYRYYYGGGVE